MKWGCIILSMLLLVGCRQEKKASVDPMAWAVITGHIVNRQVYPQQYSLKLVVPSFWNAQTIVECEIKEDDTFSFRFQPYGLRDVSIETFIPYLLVRPGDSLHMELDFSRLNRVGFSGTAAGLNKYLYAFTDGGGFYLKQNAGTADYQMSPTAFRTKMSREREERLKRCREFMKKHEVEADLQRWIEKGMEAEYYAILLQYGGFHDLTAQHRLPADYYDFRPRVEELFTEDVIHSELFELANVYRAALLKKEETDSLRNIEKLAERIQNKVLSQFVVAKIFDVALGCHEVGRFENHRVFFDAHITLPVLREPLLQKYEDKKAYLANPRPMSDAMLYGVNHEHGMVPVAEGGMRKLQDLVKHNKGKVMLINFWDGCPAACSELKPLNGLADEYLGKKVELVSVTVEGERARQYARKSELKGQSHFWSGEDIREIKRNWHVTWSPYYLLINQEGVIVDYGSHLRPSSPLTKEKIDRLLGE